MLLGLCPARILSERYGRKSVILAGLCIASVGTAAFGFCTSLWTLMAARMLQGFGISLIPAWVILYILDLRWFSTHHSVIQGHVYHVPRGS